MAVREVTTLLLLVLINLLSVYCQYYNNKIYVDHKNGADNPGCRTGKSNAPCKTLDFAMTNVTSSSQILLTSGTHYLLKHIQLEKVHDICISGIGMPPAVTRQTLINCNDTSSGLSFIRSSNIKISNLTITQCAAPHLSTTIKHPTMRAALFFAYVSSVTFDWVYILDNFGFGVKMYDVNGMVTFYQVIFANNSDHKHFLFPINRDGPTRDTSTTGGDLRKETFKSGGGIYIEFTSCGALDPFNCSLIEEQKQYNRNARYVFDGCYFMNNTAEHTQKLPSEFVQRTHVGFGRGGGLSIFAKGNAVNNTFVVTNSIFRSNKALWGAGYYAAFQDTAYLCRIMIKKCNFTYNSATFAGGGARIDSSLTTSDFNQQLKVEHIDCEFVWNSAIWGGGVSVAVPRVLLRNGEIILPLIDFQGSLFEHNRATVGSAMGLATNIQDTISLSSGLGVAVQLHNCTVSDNLITLTEDQKVIGQGAIYSSGVTLKLSERIIMEKNSGTAVVLDSALLVASDEIIFKENNGIDGGALALYGNSYIILNKGLSLQFINNQAIRKGGAIYYKISGPNRVAFETTELQSEECFFQYFDEDGFHPLQWDCSVRFQNNSAPAASGNSISASTLQYCRLPGEERNNTRALNWTNGPFEYIPVGNGEPEIITNAIEIKLCPQEWMVGPDIPFSPSVMLRDELKNDVYGSVKLGISETNKSLSPIHLVPSSSLFLVKDRVRNIRLVGKQDNPYQLQILTSSGQTVLSSKIETRLTKCPPGYYQQPGSNKCVCLDQVKDSGVIRCDDDGTLYILKGRYAAPSRVSPYGFITTSCPRGYCHCYKGNKTALKLIDYECLYVPSNPSVCKPNRMGILCGQCKPGYSVRLGSEACDKCSNGWSALIIPMVFAALVFVAAVMYFNFDFFSGYLNAYLYSYQTVNLILAEESITDPFIAVIIGFTSLSGTGDSFGVCLFDGFTNLYKLAFNYVVPSCLVLFTFLIGMCMPAETFTKIFHRSKISGPENQAQKSSFGRAFSFVSVVCYSAFTGVTLQLLHPVWIEGELVLYNAGNIEFFGSEHLIFGIAALFCGVFIVLGFPLVLLCTPRFITLSPKIQRIEPLFEALKNCYKSEGQDLRWFAAFYFIARLILLLMAVFFQDPVARLIFLALACIMVQVIFNWFKPYKYWTMNFWDTLLLTNLSIISLLSLILSVPYTTTTGTRTFIRYFQHVLVYIPLLTIILRGMYYLYDRWSREHSDESDGRQSRSGSLNVPLMSRLGFTSRRKGPNVQFPARAGESETPYVSL